MDLKSIEAIIREHSSGHDIRSINRWLTFDTLSRFKDWVPSPTSSESCLLDIGCYQPAAGYYAALGWKRIIGISKEAGECNDAILYAFDGGRTMQNFVIDIETETIPISDGSVDALLMMEILEHFGLDPMAAIVEANRVLKDGGRLVLSTPNAASLNNFIRIARGHGPYIGLEFSGLSTNRHNRLYDAIELRRLLEDAGFKVEMVTSRTYSKPYLGVRDRAINLLCRGLDGISRMRGSNTLLERGEYLFVTARKIGNTRERWPAWLYFDHKDWPKWYEAMQNSKKLRTSL